MSVRVGVWVAGTGARREWVALGVAVPCSAGHSPVGICPESQLPSNANSTIVEMEQQKIINI